MVHGDLNGDGYQDVLGFHSEAGYYSGYLYLWMGGPTMNGSMDYLRLGMQGYDSMNYGWSKVTGDFNADGYCDVAVGAPWWGPHNQFSQTGRVYILAGNPDLHETTVANADETIPVPCIDKWQIDVYPNPVTSQGSGFNIVFKGEGYSKAKDLKLEVYNLKGQKLLSKLIPETLGESECSIDTSSWGKGILLLSVTQQGKHLTTKKVTNY